MKIVFMQVRDLYVMMFEGKYVELQDIVRGLQDVVYGLIVLKSVS